MRNDVSTESSIHFFTEQSISANIYLDLLTYWVRCTAIVRSSTRCSVSTRRGWLHLIGNWRFGHIWMNRFRSDGYIGRDVPIPWPPRSPDLTPPDFFLWDYVEDNVYKSRVKDIIDLKTRIVNVVSSVNKQMLKNRFEKLQRVFTGLNQRTVSILKLIEAGNFWRFSLCYSKSLLYT